MKDDQKVATVATLIKEEETDEKIEVPNVEEQSIIENNNQENFKSDDSVTD